ncbi:ubiquitin carboxyl-terminal hydrolase 48 [Galendromus occidentalis]|uniref:ubiquitinyl hydrolase 1 n=1 Tax=Galendromus occidentalis TaxID=34638 RepID=A0AAJ7SFE7_9ACAR|nr:ubiquitin carboxyl-terminal hydrolase 48 [Galendromus occidentalis]
MPSKLQFDQLATSWIGKGVDVESVVTDQIMQQTYRLSFEHCVANSCKRNCIGNPRCLSALGGASLANHAMEKLCDQTAVQAAATRDLSEPVGLRNLGATCYLNSILQVWFHNVKFRDVILKWNRELDCGEQGSLGFDSPETIVGHLQLIFAQMMKSIKRSVDPTPLIEVLGLDAEYQQDASECFSLLFNVILEQLRLYGDGSLANELADAYRGKQVTVIECESCGAVKRCPQDFYNMILNVRGHRDVRQCIKALGQKRRIEGDFTCGTCASKKGAVTYEEFTGMPPTLNLQLMRYRYDAKSGTKKKVQSALRFPDLLDLGPFLEGCSGEKLYKLRAALIHVGHSANSGHYIANVRMGEDGLWYRLNDENVSAMKGRPDLSSGIDQESEQNVLPSKKNGCGSEEQSNDSNGLTERSIMTEDGEPVHGSVVNDDPPDSDPLPDEIEDPGVDSKSSCADIVNGDEPLKGNRCQVQKNLADKIKNDDHTFTSTGAYLLVYERKAIEKDVRSESFSDVTLHNYLEKIIQQESIDSKKMAEEIQSIRASCTERAQNLLTDFKAIIRQLPYETGAEYRFVTTANLSKVLKRTERLFRRICSTIEQPLAQGLSPKFNALEAKPQERTHTDSFSCSHGKLSPESAELSKLKVISSTAALLLDEFCMNYELSEAWRPVSVVPQELCRECVVQLGKRMALSLQLQVDNKAFVGYLKNKECEESFWVSSKHLQNWFKMAENQIISTVRDAGTCVAELRETFNEKLTCVHGNLAIGEKKLIPKDAWNVLRRYFPSCIAYPDTVAECQQCLDESRTEKEIASQRAGEISMLRRRLKGLTKFRHSFLHNETDALAIHVDQAVSIRRVLRASTKPDCNPTFSPNALICPHGKTLLSGGDGAFSECVVLLSPEEGEVLRSSFSFDGFVKIRRKDSDFEITPEPCEVCLELKLLEDQRALSVFNNAAIPVVKLSLAELIAKHSAYQSSNKSLTEGQDDHGLDDVEPPVKRARLGRRIPNAKSVILTSTDTFVDLKVKIMAKHHITPILQVILNGEKLLRDVDGEHKIGELGIRKDSVLYVAEDIIREEANSTDTKKNIKEEIGFGGTKLVG